MTAHLHSPSRRDWLRRSGLCAGAGLANLLLPPGLARASDGYKALVCIYLYGGNDALNTIVPTDASRYAQYAGVRGALAIPKGSLSALQGSTYGLHPALAPLQPAWRSKRLAPVFNVGPLHEPVTKTTVNGAPKNSPLVPSNLFSHADQQILWQTASSVSLARTGWGARASEAMGTANPVISAGGNGRFGVGSVSPPLVIPAPGADFRVSEFDMSGGRDRYAPAVTRVGAIRTLYQQAQSSELGDVFVDLQRKAFDTSSRLAGLIKSRPRESSATAAIDAAFAPLIAGNALTTPLARQLYQIAKLIAGGSALLGSRQVFFAEQQGYDTHANQLGQHAALLQELGSAMAAFDAAMVNLGLANAVTLFTQSDFGRTFRPNSSGGTDHAWGGHQFVLGGAVAGGTTYGRYPQLVLGGADDMDLLGGDPQGRWVPTLSVDQYAATLLGWFGASDAQLDAVLPNLRHFGSARRIGFV